MKKAFTTIALLSVLGTLAVSCQKETISEPATIVAEGSAIYRVSYTVDGTTYQLTLIGDNAWHEFVKRMIALAEEGHRVTFRNKNASSQAVPSKEVVTYTTSSSSEAQNWAEKMVKQGYEVTIEYDDRAGIYTCTAIK